MNGRRAIVGLCMLCALAFSAFAAQSAMAAKGTTMFTCSSAAGTKDFSDADCTKKAAPQSNFGHVEVGQGVTTHTKYGNTSIGKFKTTIAGTAITLESNSMTGTGSCFNLLNGKEHRAHCTGMTLKYTEVAVTPVTCGVKSVPGGVAGVVETKALTATTQTELMAIKVQPEVAGGPIAEWEWTGASCPLTGIAKLVGSISCIPSGAELACNHEEVTASKTLRLGSAAGPVVGVECRETITGGDAKPEEGKPTSPLSATTVETV